MNSSFKPLLTPGPVDAGQRATFTARVVKQTTGTPFQAAAAALNPSVAPACSGGTPQVSLERQGDRISRIIVTCSCGEVIELDCRY